MFVLALQMDLHIGHAHSLKDKRGVLRPILEGSRRRFDVAAAEVDHQELWQRTSLGFAAVSGTQQHSTQVIDEVSRFVWSFPEVEVLQEERTWLS
jgi:uncharacterized protein YlxP (DUF503 family)